MGRAQGMKRLYTLLVLFTGYAGFLVAMNLTEQAPWAVIGGVSFMLTLIGVQLLWLHQEMEVQEARIRYWYRADDDH